MRKFVFSSVGALFVVVMLFYGCRKAGPGGKAIIQGYVKHHNALIPYATVYIKYNAKEFPGADIGLYNSSANADANGYYRFIDMKRGNYYLFGVGYDSAIVSSVFGGIPVEIKDKTETVETDVPVTEP